LVAEQSTDPVSENLERWLVQAPQRQEPATKMSVVGRDGVEEVQRKETIGAGRLGSHVEVGPSRRSDHGVEIRDETRVRTPSNRREVAQSDGTVDVGCADDGLVCNVEVAGTVESASGTAREVSEVDPLTEDNCAIAELGDTLCSEFRR
jgi:hypothetical protein